MRGKPLRLSKCQVSTSGGIVIPELKRPDGGSQKGVFLSARAKTYSSIRPSQKTGIETPTLAPIIVKTSTAELRRTAEIMPKSTPKVVENSMAPTVTS